MAKAFELAAASPSVQLSIAHETRSTWRSNRCGNKLGPIVVKVLGVHDAIWMLAVAMTALQVLLMMFTMGAGGGLFGLLHKGLVWLVRAIHRKTAATAVDTTATAASTTATVADNHGNPQHPRGPSAGSSPPPSERCGPPSSGRQSKIADIAVSVAQRAATVAGTIATIAAATAKGIAAAATWAWNAAMAASRLLLGFVAAGAFRPWAYTSPG